jgi:hypothetical protein
MGLLTFGSPRLPGNSAIEGAWGGNKLAQIWRNIGNEKGLHRCKPYRMVAEDGIEPPTRGFSIPCSTN